MIKKQGRTIVIGIIAFAILITSYFLVIKPLTAPDEEEEEIPELLDGEVLGINNRIMMFEQVEKADIKSIEVHNANGSYKFYLGDDGEFYIEGMEGTPYSAELLSSLVVSAGYTLSMKRVSTDCEDMSEYGLAEEDDPAFYIITKIDGTQHRVYIGDKIPTGAGYYCRYDGRKAVYILDSSIERTLIAKVTDLITPILSYPVSATDYDAMDDFYIIRDGEILIWIDYLTAEEIEDTASMGSYKFKYPTEYTPNLTSYSTILESLASFNGNSVVEAGGLSKSLDEEHLKEAYGIDIENPAYLLHYKYDDVENYVVFSAKDADGNMYAYSSVFNLVAKINISAAYFMEWELLAFVDRPLFQKNINDMAEIKVESDNVNATFTLEGEGETILVKPTTSEKYYDSDDLKNFRQFYKTLLGIRLEDYADNTDISKLQCMATLTVTTDSGVVTVYKFYPYSTRRCFYTVNGEGEFYVLRDSVEKMLNDTQRVLNGEPVDSDAKD